MKAKNKIRKLEKELKKYKKLSEQDDLTQVNNHRRLMKDLKRYLEIQKRHKIRFTIALFDIDDFKKYNDDFGHAKGDKILKKVANILRVNVRAYEKVYRCSGGGDEFIVIFSHTKNIKPMLKRIQRDLKKCNIQVSIGYANLSNNVLDIIDTKMYAEKNKKKNLTI